MSKADKTHFVGKRAVHKGNRVQGCRELTVGSTRAEGVGGASPLSLAHLKKKISSDGFHLWHLSPQPVMKI